ncbi:unnamed protein product [Rotaria sp. Silwood2]|nr:unnamed protein product [Rotaria sp. Silwood2]CAF3322443.1 unnamed protein product [Rotaria sp. Silwood2]CAF4129634.1 unnamed protein product [Rotaria sp. Silwood2]CAF4143820.1 unnamed protein product [Rotaria sp. Silwood2]
MDSSSMKHFRRCVTCLLDLPDEIFLLICRYLSPADVLYSFYTPSKPENRLHRIIFDYYTKIKLGGITNKEYIYLSSLFCSSKDSPRLQSLILSNEHATSLTQRYFIDISASIIQSMLTNLKHLKLIDCLSEDLTFLYIYISNMKQLESFHITYRKLDEKTNMIFCQRSNVSINQFLFDKILPSLNTVSIELNDGLILNKSLVSHHNLRHINLNLQTIDDLYILLDGLVPNAQTMIIKICQSRILNCLRPKNTLSCPKLIEFTLLEPRIGIVIDNIKCILGCMPNLIKLTLSIRDTPDSTFCRGPLFESILNEDVRHLRQFDYTMTHRIVDNTLIEDFIQWPMEVVFYENEKCKWIHIYSLPWPSNDDDKRRLPIINGGSNLSVRSNVKRCEYMEHVVINKRYELLQLKTHFRRACQITTCILIDMKLPKRISKVILTKQIHTIIQPSVRHLIIQYRLTSERDMSILACQFPHVKYLELLFPLDKSSYIHCLKSLFSRDESTEKIYCFWSELINFSTELRFNQLDSIWNNQSFKEWIIQNTDLKYHQCPFYVHYSIPRISIWI